MSKIEQFYSGKNVFLTGGTGFLGIAIIEKLLRSCPDIAGIYLLMRPKKGKAIQERLEELTKNKIFEKVLSTATPEIFKKLFAVSGDVGEENLGISAADREMLVKNIHIVIHSAASLDFHEPLKPTVMINLLGTRQVMTLCSQIRNLKSMVHVSSAYVSSFVMEAYEKLYPAPESGEKVIELTQTLSDSALAELTPGLLADHPNTYTYTKHLAEHEVNKYATKFPCSIVRPSMIVGSWKEPYPGWTSSKNGPQGFLMGASKGIVRRLPVDANLICDYIPVDIVVNEILVVGATSAMKNSRELEIFHCTSSTYNPFRWRSVKDRINESLHAFPLNSAVWYPHLKFLPSVLLFRISAIFVHFLPAIFLDMMLRLTGRRPILWRLHKNVWNSIGLLKEFIFNEWRFHNTKAMELQKTLSPADKEIFNLDIMTLEWEDYFNNLAQGVRLHLNREKPSSLPAARKKDKVLMFVNLAFQGVLHVFIWFIVARLLGVSMTKCPFIVPVSYMLFGLL